MAAPPKRAQALAIEEVRRLVATCGDDPGGSARSSALLLIGFAGALRRSELCAVEIEHITWKPRSLELLIPRSKTDAEAEGSPDRHPPRQVRGDLPASRAPGLAAGRPDRAWARVPRGNAHWQPAIGGVEREKPCG